MIGAGDLPVCAENDARAALIGEVLWGAAHGRRNVVMSTLGTGVGGAVLVEGVILRGASGAASHLGHTTIDPRGGLCIGGNYGRLETHFSSRAIESDYWAHMHRAAPAKLSISSTGEVPNPEAIFRAAAEGDECARYVVDRALEYLGAALVSFLHTFDPEIFILGGNIVAAGPQLIAPIQDKIARRTRTLLGREVPIVFQKRRLRRRDRSGGFGLSEAEFVGNLKRGCRAALEESIGQAVSIPNESTPKQWVTGSFSSLRLPAGHGGCHWWFVVRF